MAAIDETTDIGRAWRAVDALGGTHNGSDYERGYAAALDAACEAIEKVKPTPTAADLLGRLKLGGEGDDSRLHVMAQSPSNHFHWTKSVGAFTAGEVKAALRLSGSINLNTEGAGQ